MPTVYDKTRIVDLVTTTPTENIALIPELNDAVREIKIALTNDIKCYGIGSFASLTAAVTAIGATECALLINASTSLTANTTVPANIQLIPQKPGLITKASTYTLTINGPVIDPGPIQWLSGFAAGDVTFGAAIEVSPAWWGTDTTAVKAMFASKPSGGSFVFPPNTTYTITEASTGLLIPSNSKVRGHGPSSIIKRGDSTTYLGVFNNADFSDNGTGNDNITIENLAIDSNGVNNGYDEHRHAIVLIGARNVSVEKVYFYGISGDGVYISNTKDSTPHASICQGVRIINNHFNGASKGRNGVSIVDGKDIDVLGNTFVDVADPVMPGGVDIEPNLSSQSVINVNVSGNSFTNPTTGIQAYNNVSATVRNIHIGENSIANSRSSSIKIQNITSSNVVNNEIYNSSSIGISATTIAVGVSISNNQVYQTADDGIRLVNVDDSIIEGNKVYNWDIGNIGTHYGIRGLTGSANNVVSGNSFKRSAGDGIAIKTEDTSTGWMFGPNFVASGVTKYSLVGTNTEVSMTTI